MLVVLKRSGFVLCLLLLAGLSFFKFVHLVGSRSDNFVKPGTATLVDDSVKGQPPSLSLEFVRSLIALPSSLFLSLCVCSQTLCRL